jgi:hypothetical protein
MTKKTDQPLLLGPKGQPIQNRGGICVPHTILIDDLKKTVVADRRRSRRKDQRAHK